MDSRYIRQEILYGFGREGQEKLLQSRVAVIGMGALGSAAADRLARAGIGYLRLIDRDVVELSNLQRQLLYTERDAAGETPKAAAAAAALRGINSEIEIEPVITDLNRGSIDRLLDGIDLVLDATDNMETRMLINEVCHRRRLPWIYGGVLSTIGMTMNILPEDGSPCLRCAFPEQKKNSSRPEETCATAGILNTVTTVIASIECTEAYKILIGDPAVRRTLLYLDLWNNEVDETVIERRPDCPVCGERVGGGESETEAEAAAQVKAAAPSAGLQVSALNGSGPDAFQVRPDDAQTFDFDRAAAALRRHGRVRNDDYALDFADEHVQFKLFRDGRAIIRRAGSAERAREIYRAYIES